MREICAFRVTGTAHQTAVSQSEQLEHSVTLLQETKNLHVSVFMEAIPLFITAQTTVIQLNTTQVYLVSNSYFQMCAACFSLYKAHTQACQYKKSYNERYNK